MLLRRYVDGALKMLLRALPALRHAVVSAVYAAMMLIWRFRDAAAAMLRYMIHARLITPALLFSAAMPPV